MKSSKSNTIETNRQLKEKGIDENRNEVALPQEDYDYYQTAMEKLNEKVMSEQVES